jgi:hypothetical protein
MPLSVDNIIQQATGNFEATSGTVTLPVATTAGSTIIICATQDTDHTLARTLGTPSGGAGTFAAMSTNQSGTLWNRLRVYAQRNVAAGETSWNLPTLGSGINPQVVWAVFELTGVGLDPYDVPSSDAITRGWFAKPSGATVANVDTAAASLSSGTTSTAACYDLLGLAIFGATGTSSTIPVFSGLTNNFVEIASANRSNASRGLTLSVSILPSIDPGQFTSTVSVSPSSYMSGYVIVLYADGAKFVPDIIAMFGAEVGTATGLDQGSIVVASGTAPWDTMVGAPAIVATSPRSGSWCLELSSSAAAECLTWAYNGVLHAISPDDAFVNVGRFCFYFPTSAPAADTELWSVETTTLANGMTIWYRAASNKIGVKIGTGTEVLSDATIPINTWVGLDYRYRTVLANHTCDWQVDYDSTDATAPVAQTQVVGGGTSAQHILTVRCGWSTSATATVRYDDIAVSKIWGCYPLGNIKIVSLSIDQAATPTVVGSEANFKIFTNNGTTSTWTAAGTKTALDDMPPTIGGTSDGVTQVTVAASDFVRVPMETYTAAPDNCLRAVRWYVAGWAASGNPASLVVNSNDGTSQLMQVGLADHGFDSSTLRWICGMHRNLADEGPYLISQAKLDASYVEFGGSDDANPDVGVHAILGELAIQPAQVYQMTAAEAGTFTVYVRDDSSSRAIASLLVTTPTGSRGATLYTTISGVDYSDYVNPNTAWVKSIGATRVDDVTSVGLTPDPT